MALPWGVVGGALVVLVPRRAAAVAALVGVGRFVHDEIRGWQLGHPHSPVSVALGLAVAAAIALAIWVTGRLQRALGRLDEDA